jgi:F-type H+-transporting ATPase subunit epsilon
MTEPKTLHVNVVSPERPVFSGEADSLVATAWDGKLGILPGHAPLLTKLGIGEVQVRRGEEVQRIAIRHGYLQVADNKVVVLSEDAQALEDLKGVNPEDIERLKVMIQESTNPEEKAKLQADLEWLKASDRLLKGM